MTASRSARERKAGVQAGPLARVRIDVGRDDRFVYKITCTQCVRGDGRWSSYRRAADNGFIAAMDRWILHLSERHPDSDAPCLSYLPEAQARLQEQREREEGEQQPPT